MMTNKKNFAWPITSISREEYDSYYYGIEKNKDKIKSKEIIIFGAGIRGTFMAMLLKKCGYHNITFTDNNKDKWYGYIDEYKIIPFNDVLYKEEIVILIAVENGQLIKKQLKENGFVEEENFFDFNISFYDSFLNEFERSLIFSSTLFLGDCAFSHISFLDENLDNLKELLIQELGETSTSFFTMHGLGMRAFYNILKAGLSIGLKPEKIMIMINFDTFTSKNHILPRSQHPELIERIYEISKFNDYEFNEYRELTKKRSKNLEMEMFSDKLDVYDESLDEIKRKIYIKLHYMYKLNENTEGIVYLMKILDILNEEGINVITFIPPVNYELGRKYFGDVFDEIYNENLIKLKKIVNDKGVNVLDLSFILNKSEFSSEDTADETANFYGRVKIKNHIVKFLKEI